MDAAPDTPARAAAEAPKLRIARMQQVISLTGLGWLVLALWGAWRHFPQQPVWLAWALFAAAVGGCHALFLAFEFAVMHRVNRLDDAPRAALHQLVGAWAGEATHALRVFTWRQPFRHAAWPDNVPETLAKTGTATGLARAGGAPRRGLVLVHGFLCNRGLWNPWLARLQRDGVPFVAVSLEPVFGSIEDYAATVEGAVARLEAATGLAPVMVAHSMGGLAARHWWAAQPVQRLAQLVTIGSPHNGTWLGRWALSANTRQMNLHSAWLQALAARESPAHRARTLCFYSHCDNIVFPASTATLAGADNRHLGGVAHVAMADHPAPYAAVLEGLAATEAVLPCRPD